MYKELKISWKCKTEPKLVLRLFPALKLQPYGPFKWTAQGFLALIPHINEDDAAPRFDGAIDLLMTVYKKESISVGLPELSYSGYRRHAYIWDDYPPLQDILDVVHKALPGSSFNSLLLNRYKGSNDCVAWHSDDESFMVRPPKLHLFLLSVPRYINTFHFLIISFAFVDHHSFTLKHGSMLVMRSCTWRDWVHLVP
ncbi:hypothetical protein AAG906_009567 [Vitis piasezkii]